jgi:hypothetical protein
MRTIFDTKLSEGQAILDCAGVLDADDDPHPIAHSSPQRHANFRQRIHECNQGGHMSSDKLGQLTMVANALAKEVTQFADVRCMTPHNLSERRQHSVSRRRTVCHEEAARSPGRCSG